MAVLRALRAILGFGAVLVDALTVADFLKPRRAVSAQRLGPPLDGLAEKSLVQEALEDEGNGHHHKHRHHGHHHKRRHGHHAHKRHRGSSHKSHSVKTAQHQEHDVSAKAQRKNAPAASKSAVSDRVLSSSSSPVTVSSTGGQHQHDVPAASSSLHDASSPHSSSSISFKSAAAAVTAVEATIIAAMHNAISSAKNSLKKLRRADATPAPLSAAADAVHAERSHATDHTLTHLHDDAPAETRESKILRELRAASRQLVNLHGKMSFVRRVGSKMRSKDDPDWRAEYDHAWPAVDSGEVEFFCQTTATHDDVRTTGSPQPILRIGH